MRKKSCKRYTRKLRRKPATLTHACQGQAGVGPRVASAPTTAVLERAAAGAAACAVDGGGRRGARPGMVQGDGESRWAVLAGSSRSCYYGEGAEARACIALEGARDTAPSWRYSMRRVGQEWRAGGGDAATEGHGRVKSGSALPRRAPGATGKARLRRWDHGVLAWPSQGLGRLRRGGSVPPELSEFVWGAGCKGSGGGPNEPGNVLCCALLWAARAGHEARRGPAYFG